MLKRTHGFIEEVDVSSGFTSHPQQSRKPIMVGIVGRVVLSAEYAPGTGSPRYSEINLTQKTWTVQEPIYQSEERQKVSVLPSHL